MEEVARLSGFDTIPTTYPAVPAGERRQAPRLTLRQRIKTVLTGFGFTEVITYSFVHALAANACGCPRTTRDAGPWRS